jgi:hypothetical protein
MTEPGQPAGEEPRLDAETIADLEPREDESAQLKGGKTKACPTSDI